MKKKLLPIVLLSLFGMVLAGCANSSKGDGGKKDDDQGQTETVAVTGVTLNASTLEVVKGQQATLTATVAPEKATNKEVTWSSDDEDVVTVSKAGVVSAVDVGKATVTATTKDGNFKATCVVTVILEIDSVTIANKDAFAGFVVDDSESLTITTVPETNPTVLLAAGALKVTSSNEAVAGVNGLIVTGLTAGTSTITVSLFGKTDTLELTVAEAVPGEPKSVLEALTEGIVEAPWNGSTGKAGAITTTAVELKGEIIAVAPNGDTGYNAILDDGTAAVYLQINKAATDPIPFEVGEFAKVTCKLINYYGLLEGVSKKAATNDNASWIPAKDVVKLETLEVTPTLATPVAMSGSEYNAYYDVCKTNGTKNAAGATYTELKYVTIAAEYSEEFAAADKGSYKISDKYGLAHIGALELDAPFQGQKSTLEAFLIGANTGKGKSNAIVVGQTPLAPTSVEFNEDAPIVVHGNTLQLTYTTTPAGSYSRNVVWSSENPEIATVDAEGVVTGLYVGNGTQYSTIKVVLAEGVEATVSVGVFGEDVAATAVELSETAAEVYVGKTLALVATPTPAMVSDIPVWSTSDAEVATVDQKGVVTAVAEGTATITVKYNDNVSATCAVTVSVRPGSTKQNPLTVDQAIEIGSTLAHKGVTEDEYYIKGIISKVVSNDLDNTFANATFWLASSTAVEGFEVYRLGADSAFTNHSDIKVGSEVLVQCKIKKYNSTIENDTGSILSATYAARPATSLTLSEEALELETNGTADLTASVLPLYSTDAVAWLSSNEAVATVAAGKVTAVAEGTATITAFADANGNGQLDEGEVNDVCTVTVSAPAAANTTVAFEAVDMIADPEASYSGGSVKFTSKALDEAVTVAVSGSDANTGKIYKSNDYGFQIRLYNSGNAKFTVTLASGYEFVSVKIKYADAASGWWGAPSEVALTPEGQTATLACSGSNLTVYKVTVVYKTAGGEEQATALPVGNFSGTITVQETNMFTVVAISETLAYVEIGDFKVQKAYAFNSETKVLTVELGGNFGNLTATYDAEAGVLKNVGIDGAYAAAVTGNNAITLNGPLHLFECEGTAEELQQVFKRRVSSNETGKVALDSEHVAAGKGAVQLPGNGSGDVRLNLRNDLTPTAAKNLGFWVYNPSENNVKIRAWIYKGASLSNNASVLSDSGLSIAPGWTYVRCYGFDATIYNIQIGDFTNSGVNLTFDNIAIY